MNESKLYHYTESGLDNIYLADGFSFHKVHGQKAIHIQDIEGLHEAIGMILVESHRRLSGAEIRFLRNELMLSQSRLAAILGVEAQAVARYEKGGQILVPTEAAIRLLYKNSLGENSPIGEVLSKLADLEDEIYSENQKLVFEDTEEGWSMAA